MQEKARKRRQGKQAQTKKRRQEKERTETARKQGKKETARISQKSTLIYKRTGLTKSTEAQWRAFPSSPEFDFAHT